MWDLEALLGPFKRVKVKGGEKEIMPKREMVEIPRKHYQELLEKATKYDALEAYGVDNWGGYGDAMQSLEDEEEEE